MQRSRTSNTTVRHLYVHVPFCRGKCAYCAFYSVPYSPDLATRFLEALRRELVGLSDRGLVLAPHTIYIGGGTPTVLPGAQLDRLLAIVAEACDLASLQEWTVEANPGTLTTERATMLAPVGVNRVSIGIQSLDDAVLADMHRPHDSRDVQQTIDALRGAGVDNIGGDLIACLPGVGNREWRSTLEDVAGLGIPHVSVYSLSLEQGTELARRQRCGQFGPADAETELYALGLAREVLEQAGVEPYEVSNFARAGFACSHNLACWRGHDYLGVGPGAASRLGRSRRTNRADVSAYAAVLQDERVPSDEDVLSPVDDATERVIFSLRLWEGTDLSTFDAPTGLVQHWSEALARLAGHGLTVGRDMHWRLTDRGMQVADAVARELLPGPEYPTTG